MPRMDCKSVLLITPVKEKGSRALLKGEFRGSFLQKERFGSHISTSIWTCKETVVYPGHLGISLDPNSTAWPLEQTTELRMGYVLYIAQRQINYLSWDPSHTTVLAGFSGDSQNLSSLMCCVVSLKLSGGGREAMWAPLRRLCKSSLQA